MSLVLVAQWDNSEGLTAVPMAIGLASEKIRMQMEQNQAETSASCNQRF